MRILLIVMLCLLGSAAVYGDQAHHCVKAVTDRMGQLNVKPAQITNVDYFEIRDNACCEQFDAYEAWVSLKQCRGNVVLKLSPQCEIKETYGHGDCDPSNLR